MICPQLDSRVDPGRQERAPRTEPKKNQSELLAACKVGGAAVKAGHSAKTYNEEHEVTGKVSLNSPEPS